MKRKFISALTALAVGISGAAAQTVNDTNKGYTGNAEMVVGLLELGLNTTQGYRFNKHWSVGVNTGLNTSWAGSVVPVCAVGQFDLPIGKCNSFFVNSKAGMVVALDKEPYRKSPIGSNFALGTGFRLNRVSLQLAFNGVCLKHNSTANPDEIYDGYATVQFRIGYIFGKK